MHIIFIYRVIMYKVITYKSNIRWMFWSYTNPISAHLNFMFDTAPLERQFEQCGFVFKAIYFSDFYHLFSQCAWKSLGFWIWMVARDILHALHVFHNCVKRQRQIANCWQFICADIDPDYFCLRVWVFCCRKNGRPVNLTFSPTLIIEHVRVKLFRRTVCRRVF